MHDFCPILLQRIQDPRSQGSDRPGLEDVKEGTSIREKWEEGRGIYIRRKRRGSILPCRRDAKPG